MEYKMITEDRFEEVTKHFHEFFFRDEPLCKSLGVTEITEEHSNLDDYIYSSLEQNLSIMAVNENDEIVGVRLNGVLTKSDYEEKSKKALESRNEQNNSKIFTLMVELNRRANIFERFNVDKLFELRMLSVSESYRGKGIAKELVRRSEKLARDRGFKLMKVEVSGAFSQRVLQSCGFLALEEQYYDKWCDEQGNPIFKVDPPHVKMQLLYKELS